MGLSVPIEERADYKTRFQPGNTFSLSNGRPIEWTEQEIEAERIALEKWIEEPKNYYFDAFLNKRKLSREHLALFEARSPRFLDTSSRARRIQEERLVDLGVSRKGDGNFIKFVLANRAGWREKSEISGDSANPLAIMLDKIAKKNQDPIEAQVIEPESIEHKPSTEPQA